MIKIIAIVLIFISASLYIKYKFTQNEYKIAITKDLFLFIKFFTIDILELKMIFNSAVLNQKGKISKHIETLIENYEKESTQISDREKLINVFKEVDYLDDDVKKRILEYLNIIGVCDKATATDYYNTLIEVLNDDIKSITEKNVKLHKILPIMTYGITTVIVMILM